MAEINDGIEAILRRLKKVEKVQEADSHILRQTNNAARNADTDSNMTKVNTEMNTDTLIEL